MNNIPIFDTLAHPTINGNWLEAKYDNKCTVDILLRDMSKFNVKWGFAVGLKKIGGYQEDIYSKFVLSKTKNLFPVAYIEVSKLTSWNAIKKYFKELREKKYSGIKVHPRIAKVNLTNRKLIDVIKISNELNLTVLFCTYFYDNKKGSHLNNIENLVSLLEKANSEKIILLHSGSIRIIEMMEMARAFKNVLLDLSHTIQKYEGSSIDLDIRYMFRNFDRRICIGSDFPEFSIEKLRERFNYFCEGIDEEKAKNIAYKNVLNFTNLLETDETV